MKGLLINVTTILVLPTLAYGRIILSTRRSAAIPIPNWSSSLKNADNRHGVLSHHELHNNIRGGDGASSNKKRSPHVMTTKQLPDHHIQSILIPRQTSILTPLRFLSFLLMNISFNYCMQTAGKPMEDAVRRILNMSGNDCRTSKVNQLHVYMAKKILSSSSSSTSVELLPPSHLPSPLPLLGLFVSILLYFGGTVLAPKWSVYVDAFFNYDRFDLDDKATIASATDILWNWFDQQNQDDVDVYYQPKKQLAPAVLIHDNDSEESTVNSVICPLFLSPENGYNPEGDTSSCMYHYLDHPRRYYFELNGKRYYYDPIYQLSLNSTTPALISGEPNLHELPISKLLYHECKHGLDTESKLSKARERYEGYSHISIPIPILSEAFLSRLSSPLAALQVVGRLFSVLEDETIGKSFTNLGRIVSQHFFDAKRSIGAAVALANEVKENENSDHIGSDVGIWAVRPSYNDDTGKWEKVQSTEILPGDIFTMASSSGNSYFLSGVTIPVDCLLLEGNCVTEEAALTGESVPQVRVKFS